MGDAEYLHAFDTVVMPIARSFDPEVRGKRVGGGGGGGGIASTRRSPTTVFSLRLCLFLQLVLVSAGFDAARGDPLGGCDVTPAGYAHMTHHLLSLARGRVVVALEGGYNLASISRGMEAVVRVLLGEAPPPLALLPAWVHAPPSEASADLKGPGAAHYDAVMEMLRQGTHVPSAQQLQAVGSTSAAVSAPPVAASAAEAPTVESAARVRSQSCAHGHHHGLRADVFTPTRSQIAAATDEYAGLDTSDVLASLSPAASAADTVAFVAHLHSSYWPCLRAPYKASKRFFKAAASAFAATASPVKSASGGISAGGSM
jgi:hypothetical protein